MPAYNVYISSTYQDLKSYREKVRVSLRKFPTNFEVVGMEDYVAENMQPLDTCLRDVEACDIYLLILANRYGYVPEGQEKSITHQEYDHAKEHNKVILVFKADNLDGRFLADTDEPNQRQPSAAEKQKKLKAFKDEVSSYRLSHPEGFTSDYHLALQVMESLVRNPRVDFDGELPEDRKIFCNRTNHVLDFYDLVQKKQSFNVFLIQGNELDLGQSLVERLSKYYLATPGATSVSYHDLITDASYANFRRRLIYELGHKLLPNEPDRPNDLTGLLTTLAANGADTLALLSSVSDAVQWQTGYQFLDTIFQEFSQASATNIGIRVYWFIVIDVPDALQQQVQSVNVQVAPLLTRLRKDHIKDWISTYIHSNAGTVLSIQKLCFPKTFNPTFDCDMYEAEKQIKKFIKRFNLRRKKNDKKLLDILP